MTTRIEAESRWNERYAGDDYLYGEGPNAFLLAHAWRLTRGQSVLCVADGDGRNSVWLAEQGLAVTAFDFAETAVAKAQCLARRRGVAIDAQVCDIFDWTWKPGQFDLVVAIFIQFLAENDQAEIFARIRTTLKPGGLLLLEGYRPEELAYGTGGDLDASRLYTRAGLRHAFGAWDILELDAYDAELHEGSAHNGLSALVDLVARKPLDGSD